MGFRRHLLRVLAIVGIPLTGYPLYAGRYVRRFEDLDPESADGKSYDAALDKLDDKCGK